MKSIGIRATPKEIWYSILEETPTKFNVLSQSKVVIPYALSVPDQLSYIRSTFKDIIFEYSVECAGIRVTEISSQKMSIVRISYEAVLQELLSSSSVKKYIVGQISNISAKVGFTRENFKKYVEGNSDFEQIENWGKFNSHIKESIFAAIASTK